MRGQAGEAVEVVLLVELARGGPQRGVHAQGGQVAGHREPAVRLQGIHLLRKILLEKLPFSSAVVQTEEVKSSHTTQHNATRHNNDSYVLVGGDAHFLDGEVSPALQRGADAVQLEVHVVVPRHLHACETHKL